MTEEESDVGAAASSVAADAADAWPALHAPGAERSHPPVIDFENFEFVDKNDASEQSEPLSTAEEHRINFTQTDADFDFVSVSRAMAATEARAVRSERAART